MSQLKATPPIATDWLSMTVQLSAFRCAEDGSKVHIISLRDDVRFDVLWDTTTTSPQEVDETFVQKLKPGVKYQAKGLMHVRTTSTTPAPATTCPPQEHPQKGGYCLHHSYSASQQPLQITFAVNALRPSFLPPPPPPSQYSLGAAVKRRASDLDSEYDIMIRAMQNMSAADKIEDEIEARGLTDQWAMIARAIKRPRLRAARNYIPHSTALDMIDGIKCEMRWPTRMRYTIGRNEVMKIPHPSKLTNQVKEDSNEKIDKVNKEDEDAAEGSAETRVKEADGETDGKVNEAEADGKADGKANEAGGETDGKANEADGEANDEAKEEGQKGDDRNDDSKPEDDDDNEKQEQDPSKEKGDDDDADDEKNWEDVDDDEEDDEEGIDLGEEDTEEDTEDDEDENEYEDDEDGEGSGRDSKAGSKADSDEESEYSDEGTEEDIDDDVGGETEEDDTDDSDQWTDVDSEEGDKQDDKQDDKQADKQDDKQADKQDDKQADKQGSKHSDEHCEHSKEDGEECNEHDEEDGDDCSEHDVTDSEEYSTHTGEYSDEYSDSDEFSDEYSTPGYDFFYRGFHYSGLGHGQTTSSGYNGHLKHAYYHNKDVYKYQPGEYRHKEEYGELRELSYSDEYTEMEYTEMEYTEMETEEDSEEDSEEGHDADIEESGEDEDGEDTVGDDTAHDITDSESHKSPDTCSNGHRSPYSIYSISSTSSTLVASPPPSPSSSPRRVHVKKESFV